MSTECDHRRDRGPGRVMLRERGGGREVKKARSCGGCLRRMRARLYYSQNLVSELKRSQTRKGGPLCGNVMRARLQIEAQFASGSWCQQRSRVKDSSPGSTQSIVMDSGSTADDHRGY
jgi:hypothetical protein